MIRSRRVRTVSGKRMKGRPMQTTSFRVPAALRRACLKKPTRVQGRVVAQAEGDASRFKQILTEYAKAPEVTRQRMYIDTMQQVLSNTSKILADAKGSGNLLYLPLDKLMQVTASAVAGAAPSADPAQAVRPSSAPVTESANYATACRCSFR